MQLFYILKDRIPVPVEDVVTWAIEMERLAKSGEKIVKQEYVTPEIGVATVFLGLDLGSTWLANKGGYRPHLFETMVFGGGEDLDGYTQRYSTWIGAEHGHKKVVEKCLTYLRKLKNK